MRINHNINAMNANRNLQSNVSALGKSTEKLSSGLRINRAGDDAAGLAISEKMRAQINGLTQASTNAQDGISMIQTAEGALNETHSILQRMRTLAVQSSNGTNQDEDRTKIQTEIDQLKSEIDRIATDTTFNNQKILNGKAGNNGTVTFQVGANSNQSITCTFGNMDVASLALTNVKLGTYKDAQAAIDSIDGAIAAVSSQRSNFGAVQNRLEHTTNNLDNATENLTSAESRIRDVDMATEMMHYSTNNILQQAAQSMLAQANSQPNQTLQLLQ